MKLVSYNIQYGLGRDGRYDLARIASEIADADIIALQEVDRFWKRSGMTDAPAEIAARLPRHHFVFGANLDMDASFEQDGRIISRRKQFGTMILSRFPILSSRNHLLPKWGDRRHHSIQQGMLETVIAAPGGALRVCSVHLSHLCEATRMPQVAAMKDIIARAPAEGGAWCGGHPEPAAGWTEEPEPPMPEDVILMGDMNFTPESREYALLIGDVAPGYGRLTNRAGLIDAWVAAGHDEAEGVTYPGGARIDHCFVSASLAPRIRAARVAEEAVGSDHWPLVVEMGAGR